MDKSTILELIVVALFVLLGMSCATPNVMRDCVLPTAAGNLVNQQDCKQNPGRCMDGPSVTCVGRF